MRGRGIIYQVGDDGVLRHTFRFDFDSAGLTRTNAAGMTRYVEFWCQRNCRGRWRVEEMTHTMSVGFDEGRDVVLFQLSEEYSRFAVAHGVVERPHHVA